MPVRPSIVALEDSQIIDVWRMGFSVPGVIGLWAGESDLPTPSFIADSAAEALREGRTFYIQNRGVPELRQSLAAYLARLYGTTIADDRIAITGSGMNAVMLVMQALVEPGDNIVVIAPSWPNVMRAAQICNAEVRMVALNSSDAGWSLGLDELFSACDGRTRAIYYASPGNPTGWMLEAEQMEALLGFARARNIAILADEVYHRLVYDRAVAPSILEIAQPEDPVYVVNSFSKAWAMTGWRLGWMIYPAGVMAEIEKLIQFNTSGGQAFLQMGAKAALDQGEDFVRDFVARCKQGRALVNARLSAMNRVRIVPNEASFYTMFSVEGVEDTFTLCKRAVVEARVGLAPGIAFGGGAEGQIRLCYARSDAQLNEAMDRLETFFRTL